jgi:ABC-type sugar transport system ATPase subunit
MAKVLEMKSITKKFPGVLALNQVNLELEKGEILALLGENGAGKSTLIKILACALIPDSGEIYLEGEKITCTTPKEMLEKGIGVMYQELNYLDNLSIAENIFLGNLPINKYLHVDYKKLKKDTSALLDKVGLKKDPFTEVSKLSVAEKQMIEIAKVLSKNNKVLVVDEPTSALNEVEVKTLFKLLKELSAQGNSIIYISHKMDEIFEISDRVQVLRDGEYVGVRKTSETNSKELVSMMVGRTIEDMYPKEEIPQGEVILEVNNLTCVNVQNINLKVRSGEIVGLFGLMGSGRTEIAEGIFGKRRIIDGSVKVNGKRIKLKSPESAIKAEIAYIPRERKNEGLVLSSSVKENMTLAYLKQLQRFLSLKLKEENELVSKWVQKLKIKTPSINTQIESLSGGNQQKVVIGKWLLKKTKVLILNEPTRGIDVGAKVEVYKLIEDLCKNGMAILMISSEMPEIMGISDRIIVVHDGRITGEFNRGEFDQKKVLFTAIGGDKNEIRKH